jgi:hypothetical protein
MRSSPVRLAQIGQAVLDLRHERADQLRGIVPVVRAATNEVMRHRGTGRLAPRQPGREQRALAHPRTAGDHRPAIGRAVDQQLIELGQEPRAADARLASDEELRPRLITSLRKSLPQRRRQVPPKGGQTGSIGDRLAALWTRCFPPAHARIASALDGMRFISNFLKNQQLATPLTSRQSVRRS